MRTTSPLLAALVATALAGCAAAPPPEARPAEAAASDVSRDVAIRTARGDAAYRFREMWISDIAARKMGRYWVVELRGPAGRGLRYAISSSDGSIRERSVFQ